MFDGKVVFITDGASGLGQVLTREFIKQEAKVCFSYYKSIEKAEKLTEEYNEKVLAIYVDTSNYLQAKQMEISLYV